MKKTLSALTALAIMALSAMSLSAENTNSGWNASITLRSVVANQYLMSGHGAVLHDKAVIQSDLFISFENGFYLDFWNSTPFEGWNKNLGTEQDYGLGWAGKLGAFGIGGPASKLLLDIGTTYFDEPVLMKFGAGDILYSHAKVAKEFKALTVFTLWENYVTMPRSGFQGGNLFSLGAGKNWSPREFLDTSSSLALVYGDHAFDLDEGFFLKGSVELDWKITDRFSLVIPQIIYYVPMTVNDSRKLDATFFGGLSYKF